MKSIVAMAMITGALAIPAGAQAAELTVNAETVAKRIDIAGRQRMLAERIGKSFCFARAGVNEAQSTANLSASMALYDASHRGLKEGDADADLFVEESRKVLADWREVDAVWRPLKAILTPALEGAETPDDEFARAMLLAANVRERNNALVTQLRAEYAAHLAAGNGSGGALLLDLYGRQRMLSQKLGKELCLVASGHEPEASKAAFAETLSIFETSLDAFLNGMPMLGVPKPPTNAIADQLAVASASWGEVRDVAHAFAAGESPSVDEQARFAGGVDTFLKEMNEAVRLLAVYDAGQS